jgi:hypothetical protein
VGERQRAVAERQLPLAATTHIAIVIGAEAVCISVIVGFVVAADGSGNSICIVSAAIAPGLKVACLFRESLHVLQQSLLSQLGLSFLPL